MGRCRAELCAKAVVRMVSRFTSEVPGVMWCLHRRAKFSHRVISTLKLSLSTLLSMAGF